MAETNCPCIQKPGANEVSTLKDAGRGAGVTDTYGGSINSDVIKESGKTATFRSEPTRREYA